MAGHDTIFALASAAGRAGIAVFRLSGPDADRALATLAEGSPPPPRMARRVWLRNAAGEVIDDGLALRFPGPASFTGEDVVELHVHGGRAVAAALVEALLEQGLRPAEPGEFSRRAFEAGKLDLTQAEAIADLVDAETSSQRRQARRQLEGSLGRLVEEWREAVVREQAHLEAAIDFAEEDLPDGMEEAARRRLAELADRMAACLADRRRGERMRDGLAVAILGAPNVGKSSLLNRIAGREAAIVSAKAGTTRDVIEVHLDLGGYPVLVADTAGLREANEEIEEEGVRRALARGEAADLRLVVFDATDLPRLDPTSLGLVDGDSLVLVNKADAAGAAVPELVAGRAVLAVSAQSGQGIDRLLQELESRAAAQLEGQGGPALTRARHRVAVVEAEQSLRRALQAPLPELAAEDVRVAARALGRVTGRVDVEEMLDVIFREFCIGK